MNRSPLTGAKPSTLAGLFLVVVGLPAIVLVWLGTQLLVQDRSLAEQRETERRQAALQSTSRELEKKLTNASNGLSPGMARFILSSTGIAVEPKESVLWVPKMPVLPPAADEPFVQAEREEFSGDRSAALVSYNQFLQKPNPPAVRAGALLRAARVYRGEKRWDEALHAYDRLATTGSVAIEGLPADFVARRAKCDVLLDAGRQLELQREAESLRSDLLANRWALDQSSWQLAASQIEQWTGHSVQTPETRRTFSEVGSWLWSHRDERQEKVIVADNQQVTLLRSPGTVTAVPAVVVEQWLRQIAKESSVQISAQTESGSHVAGAKATHGARSLRASLAETGLPWVLVASPNPQTPASPELAARRRLLSLGLGTMILLIAGAGYLLWRVVQRELAMARLQTDFVAAVSHEFRTPLASLRHVTELLSEDDELPRERRRNFYEALGRNTDRLHRLVESLLDFARIEAGRKPYDLRPMDAVEFTGQVVSEFQKEAGARGFTVDLAVDTTAPLPVRADPASLGNALWNLLDNAVKYSPGRHSVRVSVSRREGSVAIAVADQGIGIPATEQKEVFRRFVRGAESKRLGIKGTGLGLAMVWHVIQAHGGSMELESAEGAGSTFRIVLPEKV
ncbi:MAG: HAMP domain-containing histidine kinase [Acidobacteria bacterium]|nr:HAMP domain-containing histidine kinase [Acidobacteriota bacterium]